jgi:hypothetical protein
LIVKAPTLPLLSLLALGCVPEFDDNLSTVSAPRLLAIQAEPAEAEAGDDVVLRALVAAPPSASSPVPRWSMCLSRKPLSELGPISGDCLTVTDDGNGAVEPLGAGSEVTARLPEDGCTLFGPFTPPPKSGETPSRPVDPDTTGGYYQPLTASLGGALSIGSVRIDCGIQRAGQQALLSYNEQYRPNENPRLASVSRRGETAPLLSVGAGSRVELTATWPECPGEPVCGDGICGAFEDRANCRDDCAVDVPRGCTGAEPYVFYDFESLSVQPRRESIRVSWYASAGSFETEQTGRGEDETSTDTSNTWLAPREPGSATLWLVIRDSRGGASWETQQVEVVP